MLDRVNPDGTIPVKEVLDKFGVLHRPNGKINIGLGNVRMSDVPLI